MRRCHRAEGEGAVTLSQALGHINGAMPSIALWALLGAGAVALVVAGSRPPRAGAGEGRDA